MSIQQLFDFQQQVMQDWVQNPRAWLLQANPVWGRWETVNRIALFDTKEQAESYIEASRLPEVDDPKKHTTKDGYVRTFRPDSLLWDYNIEMTRPMVVGMVPWFDYFDVVNRNPVPPSGHVQGGPREWSPHGIPEIPEVKTHHPKYGRDYDQGFGGPRTDMDHVVPQAPPISPGETS